MFIDKARIYVAAGRGGAGCASFRREKYVPLGGPDGGNGGRGGDVYIQPDSHLTTLLDLTYKPHYKAQDGSAGGSKNKYGKSADDLIIKVPKGTLVFKQGEVVADLKDDSQSILVAHGGRGGRGNASFKTKINTAPKISEKGQPGEEVTLDLELRLIADVGLAGFPNAGKSTLLSRISAAKPKIADYPFTTLTPNLGVAVFGEKNFVVADIPGLIEGAHSGKGLGHEFLRHIRRTKVLIHMVDIFGFEGKPAHKNFDIVTKELSEYSEILAKKPLLIAVNKMDITGAKEKLEEFTSKIKTKKVFAISAVTGEGIKELLGAAVKILNSVVEEDTSAGTIPLKTYTYTPDFIISKQGSSFIISGAKIENLAAMTNFEQEESLRRFQNILKKMGIDKALLEKGIKPGDIVRIGKQEFTFEE